MKLSKIRNLVGSRYVASAAIIGASIDVTYLICWRFGGLNLELFPRIWTGYVSLQNILVYLIATIIATYLGLWTIGKFRIASPIEGVMVGMTSYIISIPVSVTLMFILYQLYSVPEFFWIYIEHNALPLVIEHVIGCSFGGFLGGLIVHHTAPFYCPICKAKLPTGNVKCPNCGWGRADHKK